MEIVKYPHPALRWKSSPVKAINAELRTTVRQMFELMYEANGIGLAANQVALPLRLFVLNLTADPAESDEEYVFINPEIVRRKGNQEAEEGCLSMPGELAPLGFPSYGSRHLSLVGEPNTETTRNLIKLYVLECLKQEPRIEVVLALTVRAVPGREGRDKVDIAISLKSAGDHRPLNLVVPFSLAEA